MHAPPRQNGATLIVGMIMLLLLMLLAMTAFRLGKGNLQIVGNMQQRNQVLSAAQGLVEQVISNANFTDGTPATSTVSVAGTTGTDITVTATPSCISVAPIPAAKLDLTQADDLGCLVGSNGSFGQAGVTTSASSLCADSLWDVKAVATDTITHAQGTINEGASVRVDVTNTCP